MNPFSQLILVLGVLGLIMIGAYPIIGVLVAVLGGFICLLPAVVLYLNVKRSGVMILMTPQKRGDILVFDITDSRRISPKLGHELSEGFVKVPSGKIRVTKNSDYLMHGKRVVFAYKKVE